MYVYENEAQKLMFIFRVQSFDNEILCKEINIK